MVKKARILIVEDEIVIAEDLKLTLLELDFDVIGLETRGDSALQRIKSDKPDLVIMDIILEDKMTGIDVAKVIFDKYNIPVVYCTAYADNNTLDEAILTNPYGYILKPINERELHAAVKIAIFKKEMEVKLRKSEERWQFALEGSGDAVWDWDLENEKVFYSARLLDILGLDKNNSFFSIDEMKNRIHSDDEESVWTELTKHLDRKRDIFFCEYRIRCENGEYIWVLNRGKVINWNSDNKPLRMIGTISDISERKQIEKFIIESEKKYRSLVENINEGIAIVDENEVFSFLNSAAAKIFGYSKRELLGKNIQEYMLKDEFEKILNQTEKREKGKIGKYEFKIINKDNEERILLINTNGIFKEDKYIGSFGIFSDITDQKLMEEEMQKRERLDSLGILAGGIAHDFNNILTAILSNIEFAKLNINHHKKILKILDESINAVHNAKQLTNQLLTFAKGGEPVISTIEIDMLLKNAVDFVLRGSNVKASLKIKPDLKPVYADKGQIDQVINNLLINAIQAMQNGGKIKISAKNVQMDIDGNGFVEICIKDYGIGIKEDKLKKIFDPFFTTKKEGTGLGLSTVYSIIKKHNGEISVQSKIDKGSVFTILLPISHEKIDNRISSQKKKFTRYFKILIMDDNEMILKVSQEMLSQLGHNVYISIDGSQAIKKYKEAYLSNDPFDVVIFDLTIPGGLGGKETLQNLLEFDPKIKAVVSSGYSIDPVISNFEKFGFCGVLTKPYNLENIQDLLSEVFNGKENITL
ncbi:MAG: response regulator [Candidatus Cloacimonetes bacterium]|nr:response regulator [Candidatus Cloacimonadota bacterium]